MPGARTCRADAGFPNTTVVIYGCRLSIILPKRHSGPDPESTTPEDSWTPAPDQVRGDVLSPA